MPQSADSDGVALTSAAHPRPPWWQRPYWWVRMRFAAIRESSLETLEIERRDDQPLQDDWKP